MLKYTITFLMCGLFWIGCKENNIEVSQEQWNGNPVTVFDIAERHQTRDSLKLSQLADDFRIIPLETSAQALVSSEARYYVGDSCILVFQEENILMFDTCGRFLRVVAQQGRGPEEFDKVIAYAVDEPRQLLYMLDYDPDGGIKCYHLKDPGYFIKLKTLEPRQHAAIACLENGDLLLAPAPFNQVKYACYRQTPDGQLVHASPCHSQRTGRHNGSRSLIYTAGMEHRYRTADHNYSDDTIFNITSKGLVPCWNFKCNTNKFYRVMTETSDFLLLTVQFVKTREVHKDKWGETERIGSLSEYYYYNKKTNELKLVMWPPYDDIYTNSRWDYSLYHFQNGRKIVIACPAMTLLQLPPVSREVADKLTEEDNPVLLIGNLK